MSDPRSPYKPEQERALMVEMWDPRIADNPYNWVMFVFPWGKPGTPLADESGPRTWQKKKLLAMAKHIEDQDFRALNELTLELFKDATASGRGPGKSALVAWIALWFISTKIGSTTIITANTEPQLKTKTIPELGRWHTLMINSHWFERSALALKPAPWFEAEVKRQLKIDTGYYYIQAQLWSEENPDAFAGAHNPLGMLVIFDEASGIHEKIWTVTSGFFTEAKCKYRFWFVFSNPRRNTGAFFECFHKNRQWWRTLNIDSRTVEGTDKAVLQQIIDQHGEDSDEARIEVKGEFPRRGDKQFISRELVESATLRELNIDPHAALVMGVDPARFGDDATRICFRQGRDARTIPSIKLKGKDNMEVVAECVKWIEKVNPDAIFIDAGNGTGIIDRLRELKFKVDEVWFGSKPEDEQWADKRTEMWARARGWLGEGCIPPDTELRDDLTGPEYKFVSAGDRLKLESKEEMKKRGMSSPDFGDALALTFFKAVPRRDIKLLRKAVGEGGSRSRQAPGMDYPVFSS